MTTVTDRERLNLAFRKLRKLGYTAKQNFMCCGSCAWYELGGHSLSGHQKAESDGPGKVVFYTKQSNDAWYEYDMWSRTKGLKQSKLQNKMYLQWSGDGHEIVGVLRQNGFNVEWNQEETGAIGLIPA